uniref:La-related protein 7 n=1 Tax=Tetraodon nigroviridis TaxID=99883 RepID=H3CP02_TETNG
MEGERERRKAEAQGKKTETEKKKRSRVKQLLADVKKQVEFWFGDVNLHKDRFLRKVMEESEDGYVDISVLTSFNRMKKLTADARLVARALRNSPVVEVNLEGNKVRRRHPIGEAPADVDDRTVYVELLPKDVTHGWIERVFSQCGTVVYVSVPRYKSSGDSKGFAFVEFEKAEEAREAIQALNNPPQDAPRKAGIFPKTRCGKPVPLPASSAAAKEAKGPPTGAETPAPKRRRSAAEGGGAETRPRKPAEKKRRRSQTTDESESDVPAKIRKTRETDAPESSSAVQSEAEKDGKENGDEAEIKAKRRRKKKHKEKLKIGEEVNPCASSPTCLPACRRTWLSLKEEYLLLQKRSMTSLKKCITKMDAGPKDGGAPRPPSSPRLLSSCSRRCRREPASGQSGAAFAPGVIVKITDSKALPARSRIKDALSRLSPVAYVDVLEGDAEGHVRFHSPEDARAACEGRAALQKELGWRLEVISGEREQRYWQKILVDRQVKLNRPREKKRGAEKLISKAEKILHARAKEANTHIRFQDD